MKRDVEWKLCRLTKIEFLSKRGNGGAVERQFRLQSTNARNQVISWDRGMIVLNQPEGCDRNDGLW